MIATFIVVIIVMIVSIATLFSPKEEFNPEDCFSLDFIRVKLDDKIFDLPQGVSFSDIPTSEEKKMFIKIPARYPGQHLSRCQRKEYAPIDMANYDHRINIFVREGPDKGLPTNVSIYSLKSSWVRAGTKKKLLNISEISKLKLLETKPDKYAPQTKFHYTFGVDSKRQKITCAELWCSNLSILSDGLIYSVEPRKYYYKGVMVIDEIIPTEDVPETVLPTLNLVRSFRNKDAEEQAQ